MPLEIQILRSEGADVFAPIFVCDVCNERITRLGNYEYLWDMERGQIGPVCYSHKRCSNALRKKWNMGAMPWHWMSGELADLPRFLSQDFGRAAWLAEQIGPMGTIVKVLRDITQWTSDPRARNEAVKALQAIQGR